MLVNGRTTSGSTAGAGWNAPTSASGQGRLSGSQRLAASSRSAARRQRDRRRPAGGQGAAARRTASGRAKAPAEPAGGAPPDLHPGRAHRLRHRRARAGPRPGRSGGPDLVPCDRWHGTGKTTLLATLLSGTPLSGWCWSGTPARWRRSPHVVRLRRDCPTPRARALSTADAGPQALRMRPDPHRRQGGPRGRVSCWPPEHRSRRRLRHRTCLGAAALPGPARSLALAAGLPPTALQPARGRPATMVLERQVRRPVVREIGCLPRPDGWPESCPRCGSGGRRLVEGPRRRSGCSE